MIFSCESCGPDGAAATICDPYGRVIGPKRRIPVRWRRLPFAGRCAGRLGRGRSRTGRRHRALRYGRRPFGRRAEQSRVHLCTTVCRRAPRRESHGSRAAAVCQRDSRGRIAGQSGRSTARRLVAAAPRRGDQPRQATAHPVPTTSAGRRIGATLRHDGGVQFGRALRSARNHPHRPGRQRGERRGWPPRSKSAITWTGVQAPQVVINNKKAQEIDGLRQVGIIYQADEPDNPRLRLVKLASCGHALPGEEVEFTLRFDNIGDQVIGNVTIVDNLSTRLEYIAGSASQQRRCQLHHRAESGRLHHSAVGNSRPGRTGQRRRAAVPHASAIGTVHDHGT